MIASRLNHRPGYTRFAFLCLALVLLVGALGFGLSVMARQIVPIMPVASICVGAPAVVPVVSVAPITAIRAWFADLGVKWTTTQPVVASRPIKVRYARDVHGRVRGRFLSRD